MTEAANAALPPRFLVVRYLRTFVIAVAVATIAVAAINLMAFAIMTRPENAAIVQLLDGYSRLYKPILFDADEPEMAVFGASYARDAFDPEDIGKLVGMRFFNFAVSGGQPYENRRFAQSASTNANLKALILPLDSFVERPGAPKVAYGFDESVLNLTPEGTPNRTVRFNRAVALTFSGAAVGNNIQLFRALAERAAGATKEDLLFSYERRDNTQNSGRIAEARALVFPDVAPPPPVPLALPQNMTSSSLPEFDATIDLFCGRDLDLYTYISPRPWGACPQPVDDRLKMLAYLQTRQATCTARMHFFDFQYPNAVTLEGVAYDAPLSLYYRPDGHPRPTVGMLMAAVMFGKEFPEDTPEAVKVDFGVDLMAHPDPLAWWSARLARCNGAWKEEDAGMGAGRGSSQGKGDRHVSSDP